LPVHRLYSKCPPLAWTHARCLLHHWSIVSCLSSKIDCSIYDAAWQPRSRNPQELRSGLFGATAWTQVSLAFLDAARSSSTVARARCSVYWCTVLLEHKVVTRHTAYRWQQYDVIMTSWSSIEEVSRDITRIFRFVTTMKLPHALKIYLAVFVKRCMRLHFSRQCSNKL